jgi:type IV pilus assembly protein PilO
MTSFMAIMLLLLGYSYIIKDKLFELETEQRKEQSLKQVYKQKKALAINLDAYKEQMIQAEQIFTELLQQLPNKSEVPDLLIDMTEAGLSKGLQFERIELGETIEKGFYAEKKMHVKAYGTYHQIADFISDISSLERIINIDDFSLVKRDDDGKKLTLQAVTKTYYYLEEHEQSKQQAKVSSVVGNDL